MHQSIPPGPSASRWHVIVPLGYTLSIQLVSGVPHPSHFSDRGVDAGFVVQLSRALFSLGEVGVNLLHVPAFAVLAVLWCWALPAWCRSPRRVVLGATIASLAFAVVNEWSQVYVPRRVPSPGDVVANTVGVGLGLLLASAARRFVGADARRPGEPGRRNDR